MTSPIQYQHAIADGLVRYTQVPAPLPDPGDPDTPPPAGGAAGRITLSGAATATAGSNVTLPYTQAFTGLSSWPAEWTINGTSAVSGGVGTLTTGSGASAAVTAYLSGMPATPGENIVVTVRTPATLNEQYVTVGARGNGTFTGTHSHTGYWAQLRFDQDTFGLFRGDGAGGAVSIATAVAFTYAPSTDYRVRLQVTGTTIQARIWAASGTEPTTWQVSATNATHTTGRAFLTTKTGAAGGVRTATFDDLSVAVLAQITTIYGYNWNNQDNPEQTIAGRKAKFGGRNPCPRIYTGSTGHPTTFQAGVADEKRMCWSFKKENGGTQTTAYLASVAARDDRYIPWLESIPAGWEVFWCYHHEANSASGFEVPVADWRGTYTRMLEAKAQATLKTGVTVHVTSNLMAYQVDAGIWTDQWVPDCDILTWDMYGNPGQNTPASGTNKYGTATDQGYGSQYPLPVDRMKAMFRVTQRTGFAASWGILEVSSPMRNWDIGEKGRALWTQDVLDYFQAGGGMVGGKPPKIVLMWEAPSGVNWNQAHGYNWHPTPKNGPPGNVAKSQTKIDESPLWGVWKPYITGTARRG